MVFEIAQEQERNIKKYPPVTISVYVKKTEALLEEPSLLAFDRTTNKIAGVGEEARGLYGGTEEKIVVINPLKNSVIADYTVAEKMFSFFVNKARGKKLTKPEVIVCIPPWATEVDGKVFMDVFYHLGAKKVVLSMKTFEETLKELPKSCEVVVGIGRETPEQWEEVFPHRIPADVYSTRLINGEEQGLQIELLGSKHIVHLKFGVVKAIRMFEEGMAIDGPYSQKETQRYKENQFQNVIYQVKNGEFGRFADTIAGGFAQVMEWKHYLVITQNYNMEILTEAEPDIEVEQQNAIS